MTSKDIDLQLVRRVQEGDKKAFDLLVSKYQHKVIKLVFRYVKDINIAQDVAQDAFIKAYRALPEFRGDSAFYTWLYRIAINTAKNHLVSEGRRPPRSDVDYADAENFESGSGLIDAATPENHLLSDEIADVVSKTVESLPDELRVALVLCELEGMSYEEIAAAMNCPIGTVRSRIFRARQAVDHELQPYVESIRR